MSDSHTVCMYHILCAWVYVHVHEKLILSVFLNLSPFYVLRHGLLLSPQLTSLTRLVGDPPSLPPLSWVSVMCYHAS